MAQSIDDAKVYAYIAIAKAKKAFIGKKEEAPDFQQDNEFILAGYRINHHSCCSTVKSLFTCHNESVNVWSHLMGAAVFLGFFICFCILVIPQRFEYGRQLMSQFNR